MQTTDDRNGLSHWLDGELAASFADAGIAPEEARLFSIPGPMDRVGRQAMLVPKGSTTPREGFDEAGLSVVDDADEDLRVYRVFLWTGDHRILLSARLRHEAEHARQWEMHGDAIHAVQEQFLFPALRRRFQGPGASDLYDLLPSELDAHAAAGTFVRNRHAVEVAEVEDKGPGGSCPRVVLSRRGPEPLETLPQRTVYYALMFRELLDEWAAEAHGKSFGDAIDVHLRGASGIWATAETGGRVTPVRSRAYGR